MENHATSFRLDRTVARTGKAGDTWLQQNSYKELSPHERLRIAGYLIAAAYDFAEGYWPPMDKTICSTRKR